MGKKAFIYIALVAFLIVSGCKKNDPIVTPPPVTGAELVISKTTVNLGPGNVYDAVMLSNEGEENLSWAVESKPDWVELSQLSSILMNHGWERLDVTFDRTAVAYGEYNGVIHIVSNGGDVEITITLNHQPAELDVNQRIINFDRNGLTKVLILMNLGTDSLGYEITQIPEWITLRGDSTGMLDAPDTLTLEARPWGMDYGTYTGTISIVSNAGNMDVTATLIFEREVEVYPGDEAAYVRIGDLYQEILDRYGEHDQRAYVYDEVEEIGIHMIGYSWIGLKVYFQSSQLVLYPNVPCYEVTLEAPYDGLIDNTGNAEIGLGSTREEIVAVFGEPDSLEDDEEVYDTGIAFIYVDNLLTRIRVWEP